MYSGVLAVFWHILTFLYVQFLSFFYYWVYFILASSDERTAREKLGKEWIEISPEEISLPYFERLEKLHQLKKGRWWSQSSRIRRLKSRRRLYPNTAPRKQLLKSWSSIMKVTGHRNLQLWLSGPKNDEQRQLSHTISSAPNAIQLSQTNIGIMVQSEQVKPVHFLCCWRPRLFFADAQFYIRAKRPASKLHEVQFIPQGSILTTSTTVKWHFVMVTGLSGVQFGL